MPRSRLMSAILAMQKRIKSARRPHQGPAVYGASPSSSRSSSFVSAALMAILKQHEGASDYELSAEGRREGARLATHVVQSLYSTASSSASCVMYSVNPAHVDGRKPCQEPGQGTQAWHASGTHALVVASKTRTRQDVAKRLLKSSLGILRCGRSLRQSAPEA